MLITQSIPTLCYPTGCNPSGSFAHGIAQARIVDWVLFPSPGDLPDSGSPALQADSLLSEPTREARGKKKGNQTPDT